MNINETIVEFAKREREEAEKAKENERNMASIDPESYIAKEIKYQTALLHAISEEIYQLKKAIKKSKDLSSDIVLNGKIISQAVRKAICDTTQEDGRSF